MISIIFSGMQLLIHALTSIEVRAWMSNYTPLFYMDMFTYLCPNPDAVANLS